VRKDLKTLETYSIVIPAFNEQARIGATLERLMECIATRRWAAEVLVVNDGSSDATGAIVSSVARRHPNLRLNENNGNKGKGYSVRNGILQSRGDIVMFTDADLSAPIEEAELLFAAIAGGADVAIGSRWLDRSRQTLRQPIYRRFFGRCFNWLTRLIMHLPLADTQCGFKAFRREAAQTIFIRQRIERWGFDPEILYIALRWGMRVEEVAVTWGHDERSRISYLKDGMKMIQDLLRVRYYSIAGRYDRDPSVDGSLSRCGNGRTEGAAAPQQTTESAERDCQKL
jgi:glycosyltransferase involved in cell wall biosynthesis